MTTILAIETATEACSAALLISNKDSGVPDKTVVRFEHAPREHTKLILPMIEDVLSEASISLSQVDAIAFGCGPGAFTGLRIAAGIAQGVALSVDKSVIPVSTLAALAQQVTQPNEYNNEDILVAIDARMDEVYWGKFKSVNGMVELVGTEQVSKPEVLLEQFTKDPTIAIGSGWDVYASGLLSNGDSSSTNNTNFRFIKEQLPSAEYIAQLALPLFLAGEVLTPEEAQPVYIRNNVAKKSQKV